MNRRLLELWRARQPSAFYARSEEEWLADTDVFFALLDSIWVRSRHLIHFRSGPDIVKASDYLPGWALPAGILRTDLLGYEKQASKIVAHLLRKSDVPSALSAAMPVDVIHGFTSLLSATPKGHVLHGVLDESLYAAERAWHSTSMKRATVQRRL
jgi:hypothetical protein